MFWKNALRLAASYRGRCNRIANTARPDFTGSRKTPSRPIRSVRRRIVRRTRGGGRYGVVRSVRLQLLLDRWQPPACLLFSARAILYAAASSTKNRSTEITSSLARSRRCIERPRGELLFSRSRKRANAIAPIEGESRRRD